MSSSRTCTRKRPPMTTQAEEYIDVRELRAQLKSVLDGTKAKVIGRLWRPRGIIIPFAVHRYMTQDELEKALQRAAQQVERILRELRASW